ncbi:MAG TPA: amino acid ABC transporter substrate-binding protein [Acidobacteriota bacterium]|nr:amino acid ABC transporter substrate-binding protein [Acidobacteriota bacterium]
MKYLKIMIGSVLVALVCTGPALGDELTGTLKKVKSSGTLTIGYRESSPPFSFNGPDKRPIGYSIDLCLRVASAIQKQLGMDDLKLNWVPVTIENRIQMVADGKADIECGSTTNTLSREEKVDFSLMTFVDGGSLLTTTSTNIKGLEDLSGKRIAIVPGSTTEKSLADFLKKQFVSVKMVKVKDHSNGLAALEKGDADAYATDRGILIGLAITSKDPKRFVLANFVFSYEPYGFIVRRNDPDFRLAVNRALAALYRSGDVIPIYDHWFGAFGKPSPEIQAMYLLNGLPE